MENTNSKSVVQVLYDFEPSYADELKVKAGEILQILYEMNQDWVYAKSLMIDYNDNTLIGILPKNFVRNINIPKYLIDENSFEKLFLAIEDFDLSVSGDLEFKKNDLIISQSNVDENWLFGYCTNDLTKTGIFPMTHIAQIFIETHLNDNSQTVSSTESNASKNLLRQAISIYAFDNTDHSTDSEMSYNYLCFNKGDYILVTGELDDQNWLQGENLNGEKGIFPANYVQYISNDDTEISILNRTQRRYTLTNTDSDTKTFEPTFDNNNNSYINTNTDINVPSIWDSSIGTKLMNNEIMNSENQTSSSSNEASYSINNFNDNLNVTITESIISTSEEEEASIVYSIAPVDNIPDNKYCLVDFDFQPLHKNELECKSGDYLKLIQTIEDHVNEWIIAEDTKGEKGLVPLNFVTLLIKDYPEVNKLFQQNNNHLETTLKHSSNVHELKIIGSENIKNFQKKILNSNDKDEMKESNNTNSNSPNKSIKQMLLNESSKSAFQIVVPNDYTKINDIEKAKSNLVHKQTRNRPKIPPKPNLKKLATIQHSGEQIRPVIFNSELLENIKTLETKIEKEELLAEEKEKKSNINLYLNLISNTENIIEKTTNSQLNTSTDKDLMISYKKLEKEKEEEDSKNLENLKNDLTNMKELFVESALNRECAIAQINDSPNLNKAVDMQPDMIQETSNEVKEAEIIQNDLYKAEKIKIKKSTERKYSIDELYETEKAYYAELTLCYEAFMDDENAPWEFDKHAMFDELKLVTIFSNHLINNLETELNGKSDDQIRISICLTESAEDMKMVYAKYLQNHSNLNSLIKIYESNTKLNNYINDRLETLKDKCKIINLQSLLIKPVQRIFKYPLFLKRIYENTEEDHCDHENLIHSLDVFTKMLEFINDYKRRKDLVSKYLKNNEEEITIGDMMKKLTLKTFKKKTTRFSVQFSNILGIYNQQVIDETFYKIESNFKVVEKHVQTFIDNLNIYISCLKNQQEAESVYYKNLVIIFEDETRNFKLFMKSSEFREKSHLEVIDKLNSSIVMPLESLQSCFDGPNKLIEKRNDKLVDYESYLSEVKLKNSNGPPGNVSKDLENDLDQSKKDYEALNEQLIEELPILIQKSVRILFTCLVFFSSLIKNYFEISKTDLEKQIDKSHLNVPLHQKPSPINVQDGRGSLQITLADTYTYDLDQQAIQNQLQTELHRTILKQNFKPDQIYKVTKEYSANIKLCQLSLNLNDIVGLIKPYDPSNQKHIWMVHNGETKGFIPCDVLEPYIEKTQTIQATQKNQQNVQNNLMDFNENKNDISLTEKRDSLKVLKPIIEEYCVVIFDFKAQMPNMISINDGDIVQVLEKHDKQGNSDWWLVESYKNIGYVPKTYVKLLD